MRQAMSICAGVMFFTLSACAQWGAPRPYERGQGRAGIIDRALSDLDSARSYRFVDGHERKHFEQARRDLLRFREHWYEGRFDKDRLDGAIDNLNHLAQADQVHPRDRRNLWRDVEALRDFRASRGGAYRDRWRPF